MISSDKWAQARALGFGNDELLEVVEEDYPDYAPKIRQARSLGFSSDDIVNELNDMIISAPKPQKKETAASTLVQATQKKPLTEKIYKPRELTPEQLKKMSITEKMEYADELNRYRELKQSKGFVTQGASALTLGLSEHIPGMETKRGGELDSEDIGGFLGFLTGSALPVHAGYKVFGAPLVKLASQSPKLQGGLRALARMTGMGLTGGVYSEAHEAIRDARMPTPEGFLKHAEDWAKFDAVLQSLGLAGRMARRFASLYRKAPEIANSPTVEAASEGQKALPAPAEQKLIGYEPPKPKEAPSVDEKINQVIKKVNLEETNPEVLREQVSKAIDEVFPERLQLSAEEANLAMDQVGQAVEQMTDGQLKKLASQAVARRMVRTPEQLENFAEEYQAIYPGLSGQPKDKSRKFLNKYAERNVREIEIQPGESEIKGLKAEPQTELDYALVRYRNAKAAGNEKETRKALQEVRRLKKKVEKAKPREEPAPKDKAPPEQKRPIVSRKEAESIQGNIDAIKNQIEKTKSKPETKSTAEKLRLLDKNLADQEKKLAKAVERLPKEEAKKGTLVEYTGPVKRGERLKASSPEDLHVVPDGETEAVKAPFINSKGEVEQIKIDLTPEEQSVADQFAQAMEGDDAKKAADLGAKLRDQVFKRLTVQAKSLPLKVEKHKPKVEKKREPITEEGMSVEESIEYPKTTYEKAYDAVGEGWEKAKSPVQASKQIVADVNTALFNALAPLEALESGLEASARPSTAIKQARTAASEVSSVMEYGRFNNVTNTFDTISLSEGYAGVPIFKLKKDTLPGEFSIEQLNEYRKAKITLKRQAEGKKVGVSTEDAKKVVQELSRYEPLDKKIRQFQQETLQAYGKDILGQELIDLWNSDYYAPLYRVMDHGNDAIFKAGSMQPKQWIHRMKGSERKSLPPSESDVYNLNMLVSNFRKNEAVLNYKKGVQSGQLPGRIRQSKNTPLPAESLEKIDIDPKLRKAVENLYSQTRKDGFTPDKNVLRGWENGKPFEIEVPPEVFQAYQTLAPLPSDPMSKFLIATKNLYSQGIARSTKLASILVRDGVNGWLTSKTSFNPFNFLKGLWSAVRRDKDYQKFVALGGDAYAKRLITRADRINSLDEIITPGSKGITLPFDMFSKAGRKIISKIDDISMTVPLTEFKTALKKYGDTPNGRVMAMLEARSVTYDPSRKGSSNVSNSIGAYLPFYNVAAQEFSQVANNAVSNPIYWAKGLSAIAVPSIILKMYNEDNPDYQSLSEMDKAMCWHVYSGDSHYRFPIMWLHGVLFKAAAEAMFDTARGLGGDAWKAVFNLFLDNVSGDIPPIVQGYVAGTVGKVLPSPIATVTGQESKHPDVVPKRLQNVPPEKQYTSRTSYLARKFGNLWGVSPMKIEAVAKSFGGVAVQDALNLVDEIAYWSGLAEDKRPEKHYLSLLGFEKNSPPSRTKTQERFYNILEDQRQQKAVKEKPEGVDLSKYNTQISRMFRQYREIEESTMDAKEKRKQMDEKQREINDAYVRALVEYDRAQ